MAFVFLLCSFAGLRHYELEDGTTEKVSAILPDNAKPVLKWMEGWNADFHNMQNTSELPKELNDFVSFLEAELGIPVAYLSIGPGREQILKMK